MRVCSIAKSYPLDRTSEFVLRAVRRSILRPEVAADGVVVPGSHLEGFQG